MRPPRIGERGAERPAILDRKAIARDGSASDMIFGVGYLIGYLSQYMVLQPGALISTGTPADNVEAR